MGLRRSCLRRIPTPLYRPRYIISGQGDLSLLEVLCVTPSAWLLFPPSLSRLDVLVLKEGTRGKARGVNNEKGPATSRSCGHRRSDFPRWRPACHGLAISWLRTGREDGSLSRTIFPEPVLVGPSRALFAAVLALGILSASPAFPGEGSPPAPPADHADLPRPAREPGGSRAVVGEVRIRPGNIFDLEDPRENNWLYRLANRFHIRTRPSVISGQLLFREGETYVLHLLEESERILRSNRYFFDARVHPVEERDGRVDVEVNTRDVWTLLPGFSFHRAGGKNTTGIDLQETNVLGLGSALSILSTSTPDRDTRSLRFTDGHLFRTWLRADLLLENSSDGSTRSYHLERPFYALDSRWAGEVFFSEQDRIATLDGAGAIASRFRVEERRFRVSGGWSPGHVHGRTWRFLLGATRKDARFAEPPEGAGGAPLPAERVLAYPFVGIEGVEDDFDKTRNHDQIGRTEDFALGLRLRASLGYADPRFGSDRHALLFSASLGKGARFGERWTVLFDGSAEGRVEDGTDRDTTLSAGVRSYLRMSRQWLFFASASGTRVFSPDDDHQLLLGGDNGLRGYPREYLFGDRRFLATLEQRYYTDWYPFRLFRLGGAVFFDVGRAWGGDRTGLPVTGLLRNAGVGLRIGMTRSGLGNVVHVDVAFPFDGDPSISGTQILVETKHSF